MRYFVQLGGNEIVLDVVKDGDNFIVKSENGGLPVDIASLSNGSFSAIINGSQYDFHLSNEENDVIIYAKTGKYRAQVFDERDKMLSRLSVSSGKIGRLADLKAPMPGLVVRVEVESGQHFEEGDGLIVVQAMKMENELRASHSGVVKDIKVGAGQAIEKGQILITFE